MNSVGVAVVLLAGGIGSRMGKPLPKQFLSLADKVIAHHSLDVFLTLDEVDEIVIVCHPSYRSFFDVYKDSRIHFALPGVQRQDSVWNGLEALRHRPDLVCIHDAARPMIDVDLTRRVLAAGLEHGAATVGMPLRFTLKQSTQQGFVDKTLDRSLLWEIQTPQVIQRDLLLEGFEKVHRENLQVTDDVSVVELLAKPVKLVMGNSCNIKITTPEDLIFAEQWLAQKHAERCEESCVS